METSGITQICNGSCNFLEKQMGKIDHMYCFEPTSSRQKSETSAIDNALGNIFRERIQKI